ncbi:hypothetical protein LTZ12_08955 [Lacticaseibacillus paracasei]|uniref:hypothetical protein n=1 Tax=Lacticaseibacillus paracasei TaxID=1597 RepID=UPI00237EF5CA|nr:hypothetical protein [Lacticaseibacillus paracasei]MDE3305032.1 hypothetical protein [Lacticaseibacillus paracasei]
MSSYNIQSINATATGQTLAMSKPVADTIESLGQIGSQNLGSIDLLPNIFGRKAVSRHALCAYFKQIKAGDTVFIQYPLYISYPAFWQVIHFLKYAKKCRLIFIVHDINSLRIDPTVGMRGMGHTNDVKRSLANEVRILRLASEILVPTAAMRDFLKTFNQISASINIFGLYEHLSNSKEIPVFPKLHKMVFAGNLNKARFLSQLNQSEFHYEIYGNKPSTFVLPSSLDYRGSYPSEELSSHFTGGFGLVWDGSSIDGISGVIGDYLRYNSPFKASMFLASGLPVIVWRQSAIANFVESNNLGLAVDSLAESESAIQNITDEKYNKLTANVRSFGLQLRQGVQFTTALKRALISD